MPEDGLYQQDLFQVAGRLLQQSKTNASQRRVKNTLTREDIMELLLASDGRCAVTGLPFDFAPLENTKRHPWMPSLDRINHSKGYHAENIRIVCFAVNVAMNQWGEQALYRIVDAINAKSLGVDLRDQGQQTSSWVRTAKERNTRTRQMDRGTWQG